MNMVKKASQTEVFSPFFEEDLPDIVHGHEIWVEHGMNNVSPGDTEACDLCFGHNMKSDRAVKIEKITPVVFGPREKNHAVEVSDVENCLLLRFTPAFERYHIIGVEYDGGILNLPHSGLEGPRYYYQYTKSIVLVGDFQADPDLTVGHELEIVPLGYRRYKVGEHIRLKVLYDRHALSNATVYGIHINNHDNPTEVTTDGEGMVDIELERDGKWMFKVGYKDPKKGVQGLYDKKVMTATFTIMDVGDDTWK